MKTNVLQTGCGIGMALIAAGMLWIGKPFPVVAQRMSGECLMRRKVQRRLLCASHADDECKAEDYEDVSYDAPVSFSLTTHIPLAGRFSLGTGLACTFLSNSFRHSHFGMAEGETRLYYLGIPANLSGELLKTGRWTVYLSIGGTVEKGLQKVHRLTTRCGHCTTTATRKTSIPGLEWSLMATAGLSYRMFGKWVGYVEQKLNYYFDTGQPLSAHTDSPFPHTLGLGIRYCF
ncbi:MAG: hypothetical protein LBU08_00860 [Tannerellaceae bacterium]|jgi:hypothetical protein|nr:hypothetical protein [Tannerellaceae bacterium]